jgi:hypothetical protein
MTAPEPGESPAADVSAPLPSAEARGQFLRRFEASASAELSLARLRLVTATVALMASVAVLLSKVPVTIFLVALVGVLISLAWIRQGLQARKRALRPSQFFLELCARGLLIGEGARVQWLPWGEVCDIAVDEERLDIVLKVRVGGPVRVEPRYPGIAIHDLMATLRNAWREATDS